MKSLRLFALSLLIGLIIFSPLLSAIEDETELVLRDVSFFGCKRSSPARLLGIIDLKVGSAFDETAVKTVRQRLLDLEMFKGVEVEKRVLEGQVFLIITVEENSPFILDNEILLNALSSDYPAEENELYYLGGSLKRVDFTGGRHTLSLHAGIGAQDFMSLSFTKQTYWNGQYGAEIGLTHYNTAQFVGEQTIDKGYAKVFFNKTWLHFSLRWWAELDRLWLPDLINEAPNPAPTATFWRSGISANLDLRDKPLFPRHGLQLLAGVYRTWQESRQSYDALSLNLSVFAPGLRKAHSLALNLSGLLTSDTVPLFDRLSLGGYRGLRGQKSYEQAASQALWGGAEYRISIGNFNTGQSMVIASSIYLFADVSVVGEELAAMLKSHLQHSAGIGFLWQVGQGNTLRFDFCLSPKFRFTVGTGWKF